MADPIFWLALSLLLVAVSLTAVLMAAVPALRELGRASRSAEKLFDTLSRELPPTLEAIRKTGLEITELTDEVSEGVQHAGKVIHQVDQSVHLARNQAQQLQVGTQSLAAGLRAAWRAWQRSAQPSASSTGKARSQTNQSQGASPSPTQKSGTKPSRKYSPDGRNLRFAKGEAAEPRPGLRPKADPKSRPELVSESSSEAALEPPTSHAGSPQPSLHLGASSTGSTKHPPLQAPKAASQSEPTSADVSIKRLSQMEQPGTDQATQDASNSTLANGSAREAADLD